jgi:hypothetical protein
VSSDRVRQCKLWRKTGVPQLQVLPVSLQEEDLQQKFEGDTAGEMQNSRRQSRLGEKKQALGKAMARVKTVVRDRHEMSLTRVQKSEDETYLRITGSPFCCCCAIVGVCLKEMPQPAGVLSGGGGWCYWPAGARSQRLRWRRWSAWVEGYSQVALCARACVVTSGVGSARVLWVYCECNGGSDVYLSPYGSRWAMFRGATGERG